EGLEMAAKEKGIEVKGETQGSIGGEDELTQSYIDNADAVIIAASTTVDKSRFIGKRLIEKDVDDAIHKGEQLIDQSLNANIYQGGKKGSSPFNFEDESTNNAYTESGNKHWVQVIYSHLMTGVSYMIPFVVAGGILIALAFAFGGIDAEGELASTLNELGGTAMTLMWAALGGYVAYSIASRPGLVPGMVIGLLANSMDAGFLGTLVGGFLAGYVILLLRKTIKLPKNFSGLLPVLILPLFSVLISGLIFVYVIGVPLTALNDGLTNWLEGLTGINSVLLGMIIGAMMAIDLAGPVGKAAYFFGVASLTNLGSGE